jgi:hypothetical protein
MYLNFISWNFVGGRDHMTVGETVRSVPYPTQAASAEVGLAKRVPYDP